jgi:hypothetical protein
MWVCVETGQIAWRPEPFAEARRGHDKKAAGGFNTVTLRDEGKITTARQSANEASGRKRIG